MRKGIPSVPRSSVGKAASTCVVAFLAIGATDVLEAPGEGPRPRTARTSCDKFAAPGGSDRAPGTATRPFRTAQRLIDRLRAGQRGCLRTGSYVGSVEIASRGTAARPITLSAAPGESARIVGRIVVTRRSAHLTIRGLYLNGRNRRELPSPTVNGRNITFARNDVTNQRTAICFVLGHSRYGTARRTTIVANRIHDCGRVAATNKQHGLYVSLARDTRVLDNWIVSNADRGIQLYPDARRTYIAGNVIDSNGQGLIFGGDGATASGDTVVEGNVISNSTLRHNVEAYYPAGGTVGSNNLVGKNCIGGGARDLGSGGILEPPTGFEATDNEIAVPQFRAPRRGDYRLRPDAPCAETFSGDPGRVPGPAAGPPPLRRR